MGLEFDVLIVGFLKQSHNSHWPRLSYQRCIIFQRCLARSRVQGRLGGRTAVGFFSGRLPPIAAGPPESRARGDHERNRGIGLGENSRLHTRLEASWCVGHSGPDGGRALWFFPLRLCRPPGGESQSREPAPPHLFPRPALEHWKPGSAVGGRLHRRGSLESPETGGSGEQVHEKPGHRPG